jgi:glycosyltransferase involved in cell wall biosynthesis
VRILLPVWRNAPERCFYQEFHRGIAEALRELGHEPIQYPFANAGRVEPQEAQALCRLIERTQADAVFDLACWGFAFSRLTIPDPSGQRVPLFDAFSMPVVGLLFDHPFNQAINAIAAKRLYAAYPDLGHPQQARLAFPRLTTHADIFIAPAIRPQRAEPKPAQSTRDIDVLYIGNLAPEALRRSWHDPALQRSTPGLSPRLCDLLADAVLAQPERSLHLSTRAVIQEFDPPPAFDFLFHLRCVEHFLRHVFRHDAVGALARSGARMQVVGKGWRHLAFPGNARCTEQIDYDGLFQLAARARICLDASTYLDGVNDRVFSYVASGAACFTNAAGYLRPALGHDGGVRFYSMRDLDALAAAVGELLARPRALQQAAGRARDGVLAAHTWRHRVERLLNTIAGGNANDSVTPFL